MELRRCLSLVLLATVMMTVRVQGIRLSINPVSIVDGKTPSFTIRCDTDAPSTDTVYAIRITKPPSTTNLAFVDSSGASVDASIQQRATATGSVTPAAGSSLTLTFTDAISCSDAGDYMCAFTSRITQSATVNQSLQATSDPHSIEMIARPTMVTFNRNDTVELVCSGSVGKPVQGNWIWESRDDALGSTWTSLRPGLTPVDETPVSNGLCQMSGRSTLNFRVQMEDDNRMYRCYFRDNQHSGNFTFNVIDPNAGANTGENTDVAQGNAGMIVGIVLGVLAFIAIVVVLVFFFVFRKKRSKGDDYDTGEGKNGPAANTEAELHGNPVYTLPSTHPKYHLDNEGMGTESTTDDYPEEVVIDPRKKKEIEEEEKKKQKTRNVLSGLQSNQLFQRRSMKNKDKDDRYGVDNQAMDGNSHDQDPNDRHGRSRRDPYANEGRRPRDRHDRDHDRDRDPDRYPPQEAPYPESRGYDQSFEDDDGTDNRGYVPPEAIGSAV